MIEIPENFSKMSWLQLLVVCLKIIIYFDTADIPELNEQVGGAESAAKNAVAGAAKEAVSTATDGAKNAVAGAAESAVAGAAKEAVSTATDVAKNAVADAGEASDTPSGSSEGGNTPSTDPAANNKKKAAIDNALKTDMSDDKDLQNQRPGFLNNNWIVFALKEIYKLVRKIMKTVTTILSKLFAEFIFAATFPAFPFFLIMGAMYSFVKYGAFKIREV